MLLSNRLQTVKPSATLAIMAKTAELKAQGKEIISVSAGEPDFETPEPIKEAAIGAIREGFTHYTPVDGIPPLKKAIVQKFANENNLQYAPEQIIVSTGIKQGIYNLFQAIINPGDEVLIPAPYWVSYPDMVRLAEGSPVIVSATMQQHFKLSPEDLAAAITPKTKCIILNSPSNPSGVGYTRQELEALGKVLLEHPQVVVISDDIYEHILWSQEPFSNIINACPDLNDQTVVFNGVSKAYAMTGWRIGYAAGPKELILGMKKVQSQSTSNPNSIAQVAAQAAIESGTTLIQDMVKAFKERHDYIVPALNSLDGVECLPSDGTFYAFPDFNKVIAARDDVADDIELAKVLLEEVGVAIVPGTSFGASGHMRLSYATGMEQLQQAFSKLQTFLS